MDRRTGGRDSLILMLLGVAVMLGGMAILVMRHDGTNGYAFLGIGAVIFGTSGYRSQRGCHDFKSWRATLKRS